MALTKATYSMIVGAAVNVMDYGAVGDGVTDDLAAFNEAKAAAAATNRAIYIPAPKGFKKYYKLSAAWVLDTQSLSVFGDGTASCVVSHSATGDDAIRITASHVSIRDIGISGITTSGNGLHLNIPSGVGQARIEGVWVGWMGVDGFRITKGQSNIFTDCSVDQNSGYRPITLTSGAEGFCLIGFNILSDAGGNTNNTSFVNCRANAGGLTHNVKFGDLTPGNPKLESCNWVGGLIQGSGNFEEVSFVNCKDCNIQGCHIEPTTGSYLGFVVSMQGCSNCVIRNCNIQGDSRFLGSFYCGFQNVRTMGLLVDANSENCFFYDGDYDNNNAGPLSGEIRDFGKQTVFRNLFNANNERYRYGDSLPTKHQYFSTNMQTWVGGASPTVPCGFINSASATIAREPTIKKSFDYSCKITSASGTRGIRTRIGPVNYLQGKRILVQAWVYNETTPGIAGITMLVDNSSSFTLSSGNDGVWEKMLVSFDVPTSASTAIDILFTAQDAGTIYVDSVAIWVEGDYAQSTEATLDGTATPAISYPPAGVGGYPVPTLRTSGTPTITNFVDPHVGVPFTLLFDGATVIQDNAVIQLDGGANFTGSTNDTLTLVYGTDGIFREVSRSVN
jgi:hypothetical protein